MICRTKLTVILLFLSLWTQAQDGPRYYREVVGISEPWHKIELPDEVFSKVSPNLADIRILGVTGDQDTVEAPYILEVNKKEVLSKKIDFDLINQSSSQDSYYFTFEVPTKEAINQIQLNLNHDNFDWRLALEGSQDQDRWFTLLNDYRILAITNASTEYRFTRLFLGETKYRFLRLMIKSEEPPHLQSAQLEFKETKPGKTRTYALLNWLAEENADTHQTLIDLQLPLAVPVSMIQLAIDEQIDYQRGIRIQYLADSVQTDKRWRHQYHDLASGTLSSLEEPRFEFRQVITNRLRVIIANLDNEPLTIAPARVSGYVHTLVARFDKPATYYLVYGNPGARSPQYDISHFGTRIPENPESLHLGEENEFEALTVGGSPLFTNTLWLWAVLMVIIGILGWFTVRMMKNG